MIKNCVTTHQKNYIKQFHDHFYSFFPFFTLKIKFLRNRQDPLNKSNAASRFFKPSLKYYLRTKKKSLMLFIQRSLIQIKKFNNIIKYLKSFKFGLKKFNNYEKSIFNALNTKKKGLNLVLPICQFFLYVSFSLIHCNQQRDWLSSV